MNVHTLDNKLVKWNPKGSTNKDQRAKSSYHNKARELLAAKYVTCSILEEVSIPIRARQTCYLDFYVPLFKRAYEIHGEQHYKFSAHFHQTMAGFAQQRKRDNDKVEWCEVNGIELIVLGYDEEWEI